MQKLKNPNMAGLRYHGIEWTMEIALIDSVVRLWNDPWKIMVDSNNR